MSDPMSVFGGEADTAKRWAMSAFDPKRTWEAQFALKGLRFILIGKDDTERTRSRC